MKEIFTKLKQLFTKEKSPEALKMWDDLGDTYDGDPEFHPSLDLNMQYYMSIKTDAGKRRYMDDLTKRRQEAHDQDW